jgi:dipeptidase E
MQLVFYSDQIIPENRKVDAALRAMLPANATLGFVPSGDDTDRKWFEARRRYYADSGLRLVHAHDPISRDRRTLAALLSCDAIHLSGGNTAEFLRRLVQAQLVEPLRNYARDGGTLIGASAGAILMTPTIALDALFSDQDPVPADNCDALSLVDFEFFPHLGNEQSYLPRLLAYSRVCERQILACPDGCGVVLCDGELQLIGDGLAVRDGVAVSWHEMQS